MRANNCSDVVRCMLGCLNDGYTSCNPPCSIAKRSNTVAFLHWTRRTCRIDALEQRATRAYLTSCADALATDFKTKPSASSGSSRAACQCVGVQDGPRRIGLLARRGPGPSGRRCCLFGCTARSESCHHRLCRQSKF